MSRIFRFLFYCVLTAPFVITPHAGAAKANTNVGGVSVKGLSSEQARRRVTRGLSRKLDTRVALTDGGRKVWRRRRDIGMYLAVDSMMKRAQRGDKYVPVLFDVKASELQSALRRIAPAFASTGANARVGERRGKVVITPHKNKRALNVGASTQSVLAQLRKNSAANLLRVSITTKPPALTSQRLKGINARLGSFSTRFNPGNVKRTRNMRIAIGAVNGTLLSPNEVFSLNDTVGERTQARGYRTSIIFKNGYKVPGIGAGVSQVTGTLFNAALVAGLPIVTYRTHSRPVAYLPIARDATVAWGSFDMKFKNSTGAPVYIAYKISGSRATATLYGARKAKPDKVSLKANVQRIGPRETKAQLYRWIRRDGKTVKQQVGTSHYKWKDGDWED